MLRTRHRTSGRSLEVEDIRNLVKDSRSWCKLGLVKKGPGASSHFEKVTDNQGSVIDVLVDVQVAHTGELLTCRLGSNAGRLNGLGVWCIPPEGTEVAVIIPEGEFESGPIIVATLSSGKIPDNLDDTILLISHDAKVRIETQGDVEVSAGGKATVSAGDTVTVSTSKDITIQSTQQQATIEAHTDLLLKSDTTKITVQAQTDVVLNAAGNVYLGATVGTQPVPMGTDLNSRISALESQYNNHTHAVTGTANLTTGAVAGTAAPTLQTAPGTPAFLSSKVNTA